MAYPVALCDKDTYFYQGIELAVKTINAGGGVLGKTLNTLVRNDRKDANVAMMIAETFYEQGITAVVGHWDADICYFVQDVYEKNEVVMLTPDASDINLFEDDYRYVYRMIPNNRVFAETLAKYMGGEGLGRVVICYDDNKYGADFAEILENETAKRGIAVVDRVTSVTPSNIKTLTNRWQAFGCDAVVMAVDFPGVIEPIKLIHDVYGQIPIFGADNFDRITFFDALGRYTDSLYMAGYRMEDLEPDFLNAFRAAYGHDPDLHSIIGYESVYLLKDAIEATGSTNGSAIAGYLSALKDYKAIAGIFSYNPETRGFDGSNVAVWNLGRK
ncbi:MAG: ABC transporter substrate-binding protein [Synergistaceae bacterium]|nr:ABC transporter substrate-binding protein [Synergistaceae bacterium]